MTRPGAALSSMTVDSLLTMLQLDVVQVQPKVHGRHGSIACREIASVPTWTKPGKTIRMILRLEDQTERIILSQL